MDEWDVKGKLETLNKGILLLNITLERRVFIPNYIYFLKDIIQQVMVLYTTF